MKLLTVILFLFTFTANKINETNDELAKKLIEEIRFVKYNEEFDEDDFFRVNNLLIEYEIAGRFDFLKNSHEYKESIHELFNSTNETKRVFAYRLIGIIQDVDFNDELIDRINSDESSLLKTWSTMAVMANKVSSASDDLFRILSSSSSGLPLDILIDKYVAYDTKAVKSSCWKFIDSKDISEQVMAIQILANFEQDVNLQNKLLEFVEQWEDEYKGWVISSMALQKMSQLKPILSEYYEIEFLKGIIIEALEVSSSKEDNIYAEELKKQN
ncbi:hypothetical protein [Flammeovirga sp. SJP92]|uniref:hypothetical protein n=1 Tax=Flammeovirga sp. SJP92 TaxID=1775430 RepID=UPI000788C0F4|nr:hypothetical protein [Flammeovirga sp. SJP92]KXX67211.1 hypothetical protein AVL50_27890 [Flammeovirga sp. SJP92]